jgi:hypothetical protein
MILCTFKNDTDKVKEWILVPVQALLETSASVSEAVDYWLSDCKPKIRGFKSWYILQFLNLILIHIFLLFYNFTDLSRTIYSLWENSSLGNSWSFKLNFLLTSALTSTQLLHKTGQLAYGPVKHFRKCLIVNK